MDLGFASYNNVGDNLFLIIYASTSYLISSLVGKIQTKPMIAMFSYHGAVYNENVVLV